MATVTSGSEIALEGLGGQPKILGLIGGGWVVFGAHPGLGNEQWPVSQQVFTSAGVSLGDAATASTTATTGDAEDWAVGALSNGGWVVTWRDGDDNLQQQAYTSTGTAGTTVQVNASNDDSNGIGEVLGVGSGRWVVSWSGDAVDSSGSAVLQHLYNNTSNDPATTQAQVNVTTTGDQLFNDSALLLGGGWVTVFGTPGTGGGDLVMRLFNADGTPVPGGENPVNATVLGVQAGGRICALDDGGYVVSWVDGLAKVRFQRFDSGGNTVGDEQLAAPGVDGQLILNHAIEALDGGGWVEVWGQTSLSPAETKIFQRVYDADGTAQSDDPVQVSTTTISGAFVGGFVPVPVVTAIDGGGWVVAWAAPDTAGQGIVQRVYNADGSANDGEMQVNQITAGTQTAPQLLRIESGWVVVWETEATPSAREEYVAQRIYHIDVPPASQPPTNITGTLSVQEGKTGDAGTLSAVDEDSTTGFVWSLTNTAGGRFAINAGSGVVSVVSSKKWLLDYEQAASHVIGVKVVDADGNSFTKNLTVNVTNIAKEDLTGSSTADKLYGGSDVDNFRGADGNDTLRGGGGKDVLDGGDGSDTADYADKQKKVEVTLNGSTNVTVKVNGTAEDTIKNIERVNGGSMADKLTGDTLANVLNGNGANDTLIGGDGKDTLGGGTGDDSLDGGTGDDVLSGGAGKDTMKGGTGKDFFLFDAPLSASTNVDTISDFKVADDTIRLENAIFSEAGPLGTLKSAAFKANTSGQATDSTDRIIYETDTGKVFYDEDGLNGVARVQIAVLTGKPALTFADFVIV